MSLASSLTLHLNAPLGAVALISDEVFANHAGGHCREVMTRQ